ncbi:hypothetical protein [Hamadaea tsunoensis]|uniref:hypothetical protein n=1 Tax=Hamadaea tsunoensis TaxID=53368 RepID=UPI0003FFD984|nr:hypothetical protein [Hamadaea tsunoensis]
MVRDPFVPPAAFVSYVESRLPSLVRGARRYVGDERFADQLARDLLAAVAVRWPWYAGDVRMAGPVLRRRRPDPAVVADKFLRKAFREGVRDVADTDQPIVLLLDPNAEYPEGPAPRTFLEGRLSNTDEAGLLWERAAQSVRRRTLIAGGVALMGLVVFVSRPKPQGTPDDQPQPVPQQSATGVPPGIDLLPSLAELARLRPRTTPLPLEIDLDRAATDFPHGHRARAIFSPADRSSIFLLDDGRLYAAPDFGVRVDNTAALSPDGRYVAYRAGQVTLFDVSTGTSRPLPASANVGSPVWIDATHLVVSVVGGVQVLSVDGKEHGTIVADIGDVLVPQAPGPNARSGALGSHLVQLLSLGVPLGAPARVRQFTAAGLSDRPLTGDLVPAVGLWRGIGFSRGTDLDTQLLVRRCQSNVHLPADAGEPESGIAAVRSKASAVLRMAVATSQTAAERVEPAGWLDEATVLITANSADASLVIAWRIDTGELSLVSVINAAVRMAVADLTDVVQ